MADLEDKLLGDVTSPLTSKASEDIGHRRNVSADSGLSMMPGAASVYSPTASDGMDLSQEIDDDHPYSCTPTSMVPHKLAKHRSGNSTGSSDSGVDGPASDYRFHMETDYSGEKTDSSNSPNSASQSCRSSSQSPRRSRKSALGSFEESEEESEMDTLELPGGEDSTDYPESVASQAIRTFYHTLLEAITNQITVHKIAPDLYSCSLIEHSIIDEIMQSSGVSDGTKTSKILSAVMSKIRISEDDVTSFELFVEVLHNYPSIRDIVAKIKTTYEELKQQSQLEALQRSGSYAHTTRHPAEKEVEYNSVCFHSAMPTPPHSSPQYCMPRSSQQNQTLSSPIDSSLTATPCHQRERKSNILSRQLSLSSEADSDINLTEEVIHHELKKLHRGSKKLARGLPKFMERNLSTKNETERKLFLTEIEVEELQQDLEKSNRKLERVGEENECLKGEFALKQRQILQLNKEVLSLKRPKQQECAITCRHKVECERLERLVRRMEDEKLEYLATIENLTQQRDLLLN